MIQYAIIVHNRVICFFQCGDFKMKNMQKIIFTLMLFSVVGLSAKSKPQKNKPLERVAFKNEFGSDVAMSLIWQANKNSKWTFGVDVNEEHILKAHQKELIVPAPYSEYHLAHIEVTPAANMEGRDLAQIAIHSAAIANDYAGNKTEEERRRAQQLRDAASDATEIAYRISKSLNHDELNVRKDTFFVIEHSRDKSKISGQKKIKIKEYLHKNDYEAEVAKVAAQNKAAAPINAPQSISKEDADLKQLELELAREEKRVALEERRLALKQRERVLAKNNDGIIEDAVVAV